MDMKTFEQYLLPIIIYISVPIIVITTILYFHPIKPTLTSTPVTIAHVRNSDVYQITGDEYICFVYQKSISCLDMP